MLEKLQKIFKHGGRKTSPFGGEVGLGLGGFSTDWHCHILPGVDDGLPTMADALEVLAAYEKVGITRVWLTPHIMEDIPNTTAGLHDRFAELQAAYSGQVSLNLAAENMLDNLFEERLAARDLLTIGERGDHLLVETSYFNPPMDLHGTLDRIKAAGYYPLLAHPERYVYMDEKDYKDLIARGVKFQLNLPSLGGFYGSTAQKKSRWLLKQGYYTVAGSDLHRPHTLDRLSPLPATIHNEL